MTPLQRLAATALALALSLLPPPTRAHAETPPATPPDDLLTVAERSGFSATARYDDVVKLCDSLAAASPLVHRSELGVSTQGRSIPLLIVADPPVSTPDEAARSGKLRVLLIADIHAGEVCGKEALPILVRDIVTAEPDASADQKSPRALLKDLVLAIVPIYNPDGNENIGPLAKKRPGQVGPEGGDGVGSRENAAGLDLNRDYVKLEAPETRALLRFVRAWNPDVFIDTHTTNGSHHRYTLTYMGPTNPAGPQSILTFVRDSMFPDLSKRMEDLSGYRSFFYGNFEGRDADGNFTRWTTYPDLPRYGGPYFGLRNRLSILSEAYAYAPFKDRVLATRDFCRLSLEYLAEHKDDVRKLIRDADQQTIDAGRDPKDKGALPIRTEARAFETKSTVLGFVEEQDNGRRRATDQARDYSVDVVNNFVPTLTVTRAFAYLYPPSFAAITENLQRQGIEVEELREDIELDIEAYRIDDVTRAERPFQNHALVDVSATPLPRSQRIPAGTIVVRTAQPLGTLAAYLLEPRSADGLAAWNYFDDALSTGADFPVLRLPLPTPILTCPTRPLAEDREMNKPITYEALFGSPAGNSGRGRRNAGVNLSGSPLGGIRWLDDGAHYLLVRDGKVLKVDALTGRSEPEADRAPLVAALKSLPTFDPDRAAALANSSFLNLSPDRAAALFNYENDLYFAKLDGSVARRLTSSPEPEENVTWSPDSKWVAFTRAFDLWVVDTQTGTERRLTTGGSDDLRNGHNTWVYYEEVFNRNWRAYWWSPDSRRIAFFQEDSSRVPRFPLPVDHLEPRRLEEAPYPRPGEPNPSVRFGIVTVAGGPVRWADLSEYDDANFLISGAGWLAPTTRPGEPVPDSRTAFCYVQNRTQTWMDILAVPADGGAPKRLMRETTQAWVEPQGEPYVLKDNSFILASERDGYRHLFHFAPDGKLIAQITHGPWEARSIASVDQDSSTIYFNATERSPIASALYRVKLDGSDQQLVSAAPVGPAGTPPMGAPADAVGIHSVSFSPTGEYYVDSWSSRDTPTRVALYGRDGALLRTLDTNPVYAAEEYTRGRLESVRIPMTDGFELEATILTPPGFDDSGATKYPVWLMTYAGPHAPTVSDSWGGGRTYDEMLAQMGIVVFRVDPRSASGKGAASAWSAYKQLGVQELKDLEEAVKWLEKRPSIDSTRVGIAGGSYGGFMTSYALTHSTVFSCGIATSAVTDWRDYDSIYTERYMLTPQENPEGYDATSVVKAARAGRLHGRLLLIHGTMDDNVHMANALKLVSALEQAGSQFDFMLYPGARHGVPGEHVREMTIDFIRRELLGMGPVNGAPRESGADRPRRGRRERRGAR